MLIKIDSINARSVRGANEYLAGSPASARKVASMVESLNAGIPLPPIPVFQVGQERFLAGGFHRLRAHQVVGREEIPAFLIECHSLFHALSLVRNRPCGFD